jgi:hypothetical protein
MPSLLTANNSIPSISNMAFKAYALSLSAINYSSSGGSGLLPVDSNNFNVITNTAVCVPVSGRPVYVPLQTGAILNSSNAFSIKQDTASNIYVAGVYGGQPTIYNSNAIASSITLNSTNSNAAFIVKYNSNMQALSALSVNNIKSDVNITLDNGSNLILICSYSNSPTIYNITGSSNMSISTLPATTYIATLLIKYDSTPQASWATYVNYMNANSITTDTYHNIILAGTFSPKIPNIQPIVYDSLNPSSNAIIPTLSNTSAIAVKYDSTGKSLWALTVSSSECKAVTTDLFNNIFLVGQYSSTVSIYKNNNLITGLNNLTTVGTASFALKTDLTGLVSWVIKADNTNQTSSTVTDFYGNMYMTGSYLNASTQFYNYNGTIAFILPNPSNISTYLAKYSPTGVAQWCTSIMQTDIIGSNNSTSLAIDSLNNIYVAGSYFGCPVLLDSSNNMSLLTLPNSCNLAGYVIKYDSNGIPQAAFGLTSSNSNANINSITVDAPGSNIYVAGYYTSQSTLYDGNNLSLNNLPIGGANYGQTAMSVQYRIQPSSIYLQSNNTNGQQKYIINTSSNALNINTLSNNLITSSLNLRPGLTALYTYYNNYWYYLGSDAILGSVTSNITMTTAALSWNRSTNLAYVIITLPNSSTTGQITDTYYNISSLTANTVYTYTITPYNTIGAASMPSPITFKTVGLSSISSLSYTNTTATSTRIIWNSPINISYVIVTWLSNTSGQITLPYYDITGLTTNTSYTFTVTPYNMLNMAGTPVIITIVTLPSIATASNLNILITSASISWTNLIGSYVRITWPGGSSGNQTVSPYSVINLTANTSYTFTVTPYNANNLAGNQITTSLTTQVLATLTSSSTSNIMTNSVIISWVNASTTSYVIVSWSGGNSGQIITTSYTATGLTANTSYTFTLTAYNSSGTAGTVYTQSIITIPSIGSANNSNVLVTSASISWINALASYVIITWPGNTSGNQTVSPYSVINLTANTSYTFTVTPYNANNVAGNSVTTSLQTLPSITSASASSITTSSLIISWLGLIGSYVIITWPGYTSGNQTTPYTVTGLTVNTPYTFTVTPYNLNSIAGTAVIVNTITLPTITSAANSSVLVTTAVISWTGLVGSYVKISWSGGNSANQTISPYTATGLAANTAYIFTVTPYNTNNLAGPAVTTSLMTQLLATLTSVTNSSVTINSASISWIVAANTSYVMVTWTGGVGGTSTQLTVSPFTATSLAEGTNYIFTVTPYNSYGTAGTALTTSLTTLVSVSLTSISNSSITVSSVLISWVAGVNLSYVIITWSGGSTDHRPGLSYTITGLSPSTNYTFTVTPYNSLNVSGVSFATSLRTLGGLASWSNVNSISTWKSITLTWTNNQYTTAVEVTWLSNTSGIQNGLNSYTITGLTPSANYTVYIKPYNIDGTLGSYSGTDVMTYSAPSVLYNGSPPPYTIYSSYTDNWFNTTVRAYSFTQPGVNYEFRTDVPLVANVFVIGGGGGGGFYCGVGGGSGGCVNAFMGNLPAGRYKITIGTAGTGASLGITGSSGGDSSMQLTGILGNTPSGTTWVAIGYGGGGPGPGNAGISGGSGSGGYPYSITNGSSATQGYTNITAGTYGGYTGWVEVRGNSGGPAGGTNHSYGGGGGGGLYNSGFIPSSYNGGNGGMTISCAWANGTMQYYGGGGGGGAGGLGSTGGAGGYYGNANVWSGGGGDGSASGNNGGNATNFGSGGGGARADTAWGGNGFSGLVIISFPI